MNDYVNNYKTKQSPSRYKKEYRLHNIMTENAQQERYVFIEYNFASHQNNPDPGFSSHLYVNFNFLVAVNI